MTKINICSGWDGYARTLLQYRSGGNSEPLATVYGDTAAEAEDRAVLLGYAGDMLRAIRAWKDDFAHHLPEDDQTSFWRMTKDILKDCEGIEV